MIVIVGSGDVAIAELFLNRMDKPGHHHNHSWKTPASGLVRQGQSSLKLSNALEYVKHIRKSAV